MENILSIKNLNTTFRTGAGDAFVGCFVKNYADGRKILDSIKMASKYAALSVTRKGTQDSYLTAEEFEKFLTLER